MGNIVKAIGLRTGRSNAWTLGHGTAWLVMWMMLMATTARAGFVTYDKLAAAQNTNGSKWMAVIQDSTNIRIGYITSGGTTVDWCDPFPVDKLLGSSYTLLPTVGSTSSGIYLVQDFVNQSGGMYQGAAFTTISHTVSGSPVDEIIALTLSDRGASQSYTDSLGNHTIYPCVYYWTAEPAPYILGNAQPRLGERLAVTPNDGSGSHNVFIYNVVPYTDTYAAGSLIGLEVDTYGIGSFHWLYSTGVPGIIPSTTTLDTSAGAPISATISSLTSTPLVAVRDTVTISPTTYFTMSAVYEDPTNANAITYKAGTLLSAGGNTYNAGNGFAVVPVGAQVSSGTLFGDSFFTVGDDGKVWEDKFTCKNNLGACDLISPMFRLQGITQVINSPSSLDYTSDSVTGTWTTDSLGKNWSIPFVRVNSGTAKAGKSDQVYLTSGSFHDLIGQSYDSGFLSTDYLEGNWVDVRTSASSQTDEVYGVCTDSSSNYYVCKLVPDLDTPLFAWTLYSY